MKTDDILVLLAANGDRAAYGELARRHGTAVRVLLRRMGADGATADDIAQDALVSGWSHIRSLREGAVFEAWIKRIAARLYIRQWRKTRRRQELDEGPPPDQSVTMDPGVAIDLDAAMSVLSTSERLCVSLCLGAGYTHEEASEALALPLGTVKSHCRRGADKLKARLRREVAHG